MAEDKIVIKTKLRATSSGSSYSRVIDAATLLCVINEIYAQANDIGWETKALDALSEAIIQVLNP